MRTRRLPCQRAGSWPNHAPRAWLVASPSRHQSLDPSVWLTEETHCVHYSLTPDVPWESLPDEVHRSSSWQICQPNFLWSDIPEATLSQVRPEVKQYILSSHNTSGQMAKNNKIYILMGLTTTRWTVVKDHKVTIKLFFNIFSHFLIHFSLPYGYWLAFSYVYKPKHLYSFLSMFEK